MRDEIKSKLPDWMKSLEDAKNKIQTINQLPEVDKKLRLTLMYINALKSQLITGDYIVDPNFNPDFVSPLVITPCARL